MVLKDFKNGIHSFPAWRSAFRGGCGEQARGSLDVSLGKALTATPPPLCGRQVAQTALKWQLPSECGRPSKI